MPFDHQPFQHSSADIDEALRADIANLARALYAGDDRLSREHREHNGVRFGDGGSLQVTTTGPMRGVITDYRVDDKGMSPIGAIMAKLGYSDGEAIRWALDWLGWTTGTAPRPAPKPRIKPAPEAKPETARDTAGYARKLWLQSIPAIGTAADTYLRTHRGITGNLPAEARFHPGVWHKEASRSFPCLILPAFGPDGAVRRVQVVYLDAVTGAKAAVKLVKRTFGAGASDIPATMRGTGADAPFDIGLAEGPEDAISIWSALDGAADVGATLGSGSLHKPKFAAGTRVLLFGDNDPDGGGMLAINKAAAAHTAVGCIVSTAFPPAGFKDANALLIQAGPEALRAVVMSATVWMPPANDDADPLDAGLGKANKPKIGLRDCAAYYPPADLTVLEADTRLRQAVRDFFDALELTVRVNRHFDAAFALAEAAARIQAATDASDLVEAVQNEMGDAASETDQYREIMRRAKLKPQDDTDLDAAQARVEKVFTTRLTHIARIACIIAARAAHGVTAAAPNIQRLQLKAAAGLGKTSLVVSELAGREWLRTNAFIEIYMPRHELADEIADQIPGARVMRGRGYGASVDDPFCLRYKTAEKIAQAGLPVFSNLCKNKCGQCPFFESCQWVEQWNDHEPGVRIMTHHYIVLPKPMKLPKPDLVIIDESCVKICADHHEFSPCRIKRSVMHHGVDASMSYLDTADKVYSALHANGQELKKARELGLTAEMLNAAAKFIEDCDDSPTIGPRMEDPEIDRRVDIWEESEGMMLMKLYRSFAAEIDIKRDIAHGVELRRNVVRLSKETNRKERQDRVFVHFKREVAIPTDAALLLIDADASIEINRILFGQELQEQVLRVRRNAHVVQVYSNGFSMFSMASGTPRAKAFLDQIKALIAVECAGGRKVLVVTNKSVQNKLGNLSNGATVAHFGNIRGNDSFKDFDTVIVIGRNQPPLFAVEQTARALWATAVEPLHLLTGGTESDGEKAAWARTKRGYTTADGSRRGVEIDAHPDARVQSVLELDRECESVQAIDRLRLLHRTTPGRVLLLCSLPVDIVVDDLWDWKAMHTAGQPTLIDRLLESGACIAEPWDQMAAAHSVIFPSGDAAKKAFSRLNRDKNALSNIMHFCPDLAARDFRLERPGQRAVTGTMLHKPGVAPGTWLARHLPGAVLIPAAANADAQAIPNMAAHLDMSNVIRVDFGTTAELAAQVRTNVVHIDFVAVSMARPMPTPAEIDDARSIVALAPKLADLSARLARLGLVPVSDGVVSIEMPIEMPTVARPVVPGDNERAIWRGGIAVLDGVEVGRIGVAGRFVPAAEYWRDDAMWPITSTARKWADWVVPVAGVVADTGTA